MHTHTHTLSLSLSPPLPCRSGLFAIDREYFFQLGAYDPEIKYYGAEHVELSFRVWQCGGSMEWVPCSNVGHIYREFNRFSVDPQLKQVNVGYYLDRNDIRVAEVWMDEYKKIFYDFRHLHGKDFGDVSSRVQVREANQCKPFQWYLNEVAYDVFVPDLEPVPGQLTSIDKTKCLSNNGVVEEGPLSLQSCAPHNDQQQWVFSPRGQIYLNHYPKTSLLCLRIDKLALVGRADAIAWQVNGNRIQRADDPSTCLAWTLDHRIVPRACEEGAMSQTWQLQQPPNAVNQLIAAARKNSDGVFVLSSGDAGTCLDNMQQKRGIPGLYGCHGGATQQWIIDEGWLHTHTHTHTHTRASTWECVRM